MVQPTSVVAAIATATVTPSPTATPLPGLALLPTGVPAARTPTASPNTTSRSPAAPSEARKLAERLSDEGIKFLTTLLNEHSDRDSGTDGELAAANFLRNEFAELGYDAELQDLTAVRFSREFPLLTVRNPSEREIRAAPMSNSGVGDVHGPLLFVQRAFEEDIPESGLTDFVALIERGRITFQDKVARVAEAGAIGAVIFNNVPGGFGGVLAETSAIPVVSITQEDGLELLETMESGDEIIADLLIQNDSQPSQNVIAERLGTSPDGGVVILGAHYDTLADAGSANDNSTGVTSVVLLARELQEKEFPFTLRFILFGVEELGLFGSRHYVDSLNEAERSEIIAMLNFDAVGAGEPSLEGDADLVSLLMKYSNANGLFVTTSPGPTSGSSDHASFAAADIPAVFFFGDDFSRINSPRDTLEFVDPDVMGRQMALALGLLDILAEAQ